MNCVRCLLPSTHETIIFDSDGVCNICIAHETKQKIDWTYKFEELLKLTSKYRGHGDYDCIIPYSGGKDSSFTAWFAAKHLKMKILLVRFNHGFQRPIIHENTDKLMRAIGNADIIDIGLNWDSQKAIMIEGLKRKGDFCHFCHLGCFTVPMQIALKYKIPLILWGEKSSEYTSYYNYEEEELVDEKRMNRFVNLGYSAEDLIENLKLKQSDLSLLIYPQSKDLRELGVRSTCLGNFIEWDTQKQSDLISEQFGWQGAEVEGVPPQYFYEKIECRFQGVRDYLKYLKRGYGRTAHLVALDLRNGKISKELGQQLINKYDGNIPVSLFSFLRLLNMKEKEFLDIAETQVVSPWEFPYVKI